jgi:diketogulonate reductase-like aldo/keto reductase
MLLAMAMAASPMAASPPIVLNDGHRHPLIGYGTYKVGVVPSSASSAASAGTVAQAEAVNPADCVATALGLGYRFIDCAEFYANEKAVGEGIARSGVPRDEIFLASKVWTSTIAKGPEAVQAQLERTLSDLGTDYLDLYCIHWPVPTKHVAAYLQLEKAQAAGQIRSIGVSNYVKEDYLELMDGGAKIKPAVNQIEVNPFLYRKETLVFLASVGCTVQSYRALRDGKAFQDPTVVDVAKRLGRTPAQVR